MRNLIYLFLLIALTSACSNPKPADKDKPKITVPVNDTSFLTDNNFAFKNLQDLHTLWENHKYGDENKLYADSTHKVVFVSLTRQQKEKIIAPFC
ncbi:MAG: hypothetical protein JWQ85_983 [Mucilaginibacter sp.]|nr:hypothetical protein [Mucilaginibacter sp.]